MNILWAGGEDIDFPNGSKVTLAAYYYRSAYSRASMAIIITAPPARSTPFPGGAVTSCWLTAQIQSSIASTNGKYIGLIKDQDTSSGLYVGISTTASAKLALYKFDGTTYTQLATETGVSFTSGVLHKVDMQVVSYGAAATVNIYLDGGATPLVTYTGDVTVSGMSDISAIALVGAGGGSSNFFSEIVVADDDTRLVSLRTAIPTAAGDANAWTGAYTDINDGTTDDATVVYTDSTGQDAQFNMGDLPSGTFAVLAMIAKARFAKTLGATPGTLKLGVKTNSAVDVDSGHTATTAWQTAERLMNTNPQTTNPWSPTEANAVQLNLQSAA